MAIKADVSSEDGAVGMVKEALARLGRIDLFVNNSARAWHQPITQITSEAYYNTINTNLTSCVWASREVAKHMIAPRLGKHPGGEFHGSVRPRPIANPPTEFPKWD